MTDYAPLEHIAGRVGKDPIVKDTAKGPIVVFSLAQTVSYGDGDGSTKWYDVAIFKDALHPAVLANVQKGSAVVLEGTSKSRNSDGRTFNDFAANRVGLVSWLTRTQPTTTDDLANI